MSYKETLERDTNKSRCSRWKGNTHRGDRDRSKTSQYIPLSMILIFESFECITYFKNKIELKKKTTRRRMRSICTCQYKMISKYNVSGGKSKVQKPVEYATIYVAKCMR